MKTALFRRLLLSALPLAPVLGGCAAVLGLEETSVVYEERTDATTGLDGGGQPASDAGAIDAFVEPRDAGNVTDGGPTCVPKSAAAVCGTNKCGNAPNGCGETLSCGSCASNEDCIFSNNSFACKARAPNCSSCTDLGKNCGTIPNNCGQNLDCGLCSGVNKCGGGGVANVCGCTKTPQATVCAGKCAALPDGCGGTWDCGGCKLPDSCGGGGAANICGCTKIAQATACAGKPCQTVPDGCGGTFACAPVTAGTVCFGGAECRPNACPVTCGFVAQGCGLGEKACRGTCPKNYSCVADPDIPTRNICDTLL